MPYFRSRKPRTISDSLAMMLSSSPELTANDRSLLDQRAATSARNGALAEKALMELEAEREANRLRRDPNTTTAYAAHSAGLDLPMARTLRDSIEGRDYNLTALDDEGNAMPPA